MATMNLYQYYKLTTIDRIYANKGLLDLMLNVEALLSGANLYVIDKNWLQGELISGPWVSRYWVKVTFRFDYDQMPDPESIRTLAKLNIKTKYRKQKETELKTTKQFTQELNHSVANTIKSEREVWYVDLQIPKKLLCSDSYLDRYMDDIPADIETDLDMEF